MFDLSPLHSFGLKACANRVVEIRCVDDITPLIGLSEPVLILGEGTNTIFVDDFVGTVVRMAIEGVQITESDDCFCVDVAAGENWHALVCHLIAQGINGLENLALIPGTVGAAPVQNIGAYGKELADVCQSVTAIDLRTGQSRIFSAQDCEFAYRHSIFKTPEYRTYLITSVSFCFDKQWRGERGYAELKQLPPTVSAREIFNKVIEVRQSKLPAPEELGNAGSFFKNPLIPLTHFEGLKKHWPQIPGYQEPNSQVKVPAAWLIDQCGFKGKSEGGVACYQKQPLVLVNQGTGTADELLSLARRIIHSVEAKFGIQLQNEVRLIGQRGLVQL